MNDTFIGSAKTELCKLVPMGERIIVDREQESKTQSGILLPSKAQEGSMKSTKGKVLKVGIDCVCISPGDVVIFTRYAGTQYSPDAQSQNIVIMNESDVLAIEGDEDKINQRFIDNLKQRTKGADEDGDRE